MRHTILPLGLLALLSTAAAGQAAQAPFDDAMALAQAAVQDTSATAQAAITSGVADANARLTEAGEDASALVGAAPHVPDPALAEARRKLDGAEQAPRLLADYLARRLASLPAFASPWLQSAASVAQPYGEVVGALVRIDLGVSGPIGEVPAVRLDVRDPTTAVPDPATLVPDGRAFLEAGLPSSFQWSDDTGGDTLATALALAELLTR